MWLVRSLAPVEPRIVLDVGANVGSWGEMVLDALPSATVHSFEPIESTFRQLEVNAARSTRWSAHRIALTATGGADLPMWMAGHSTLASAVAGSGDGTPTHTVPASTGDQFCLDHKIDHIDLLKVDTEGHDLAVLQGFSEMFGRGAIDLVQFEFTLPAVFARVQLRDFYDLLDPLGFRIGKLYPSWIDWRGYDAHDETYFRCNFVAVRQGAPVENELTLDRAVRSSRRPN